MPIEIPVQQQQMQQGMTFTIYLEEFNDVLNQLAVDLRGYYIDETGKRVEISEQVLNERGVNFVISTLRQNINKNLFLSSLTEAKIANIGLNTGFTFCKALYWHSQEYQVAPEHFEWITQQFNNIMYFALHRALNRKEAEMIGRTVSEHLITEHHSESPKQGGISMPRIFGGGQ